MSTPEQREAMRQGPSWIVVSAVITAIAIVVFVVLYVTVIAQAGNVIDAANQHNQLRHEQRQGKIINQQDKNIYGSIGYQDAQIASMHQNLSNITGPAGLALTRAGLSASDPEQQTLAASEDDQVNSLCAEGAKVAPSNPQFTAGSPSLKDIYAANCTAGVAVATPPLAQNPIPHGGA